MSNVRGGFMTIMGYFFYFYQNGVVVKKITNMGQVVPSWHDFVSSA